MNMKKNELILDMCLGFLLCCIALIGGWLLAERTRMKNEESWTAITHSNITAMCSYVYQQTTKGKSEEEILDVVRKVYKIKGGSK